ncbi:MAG: DUF1501 domain-containing protein [Planctomycetaceae bacterium]
MEPLITDRRGLMRQAAAAGLSFLLPCLAPAAARRRGTDRPASLIVLWMNGGMSQLETWDPHPGTLSGGLTKAISTSAQGVQISHLLPRMAEQMHQCLLIRSLHSKEGDHEKGAAFVRTGYNPEPTLAYPTLGSVIARQLPQASLQIPPYILLNPRIPVPEGGYLGNEWNAFRVFRPGEKVANLTASVPDQRLQRRLQGLDVVGREFARRRPLAEQVTLQQDLTRRAVQMMQSEQLAAFQLDNEPAALQDSYGRNDFGRGCLVARRLVETGVRVVEVTLPGFDTHISNHEGHITQCQILDPAMSALLQDLQQRDLLQSVIVLCISEFGRTPRINPADGRDHWPSWFSCVVAGGGFRRGAVLGATAGEIPTGDPPAPQDPVSVPEVYATILSQLGIDGSQEVITPVGRPIRFASAAPDLRLLHSGR